MRKLNLVREMALYFSEQGRIPSASEYVKLNNGPYSLQVIKRVCGSWSRMIAMTKHHFSGVLSTTEKPAERVLSEPVLQEEKAEEIHVITAAEALAKLRGE